MFDLNCYYENLTKRALNDLLRWFDRNTKGTLVFDDRPYVRYTVSPYEKVSIQNYKEDRGNGVLYQGQMTIHLKAYDPLGKLIVSGEHLDAISDETFLLSEEQKVDEISPSENTFLLYNAGTE